MAKPEIAPQASAPERPEPRFKVGQIAVMKSMKSESPFRVVAVEWLDSEWAYAFNRNNFLSEHMIRKVTLEEIGMDALEGAIRAQDEREELAGKRIGIEHCGCDWPDAAADEVERVRGSRDAWKARVEAAEKNAARLEECARNADGENEGLQAELAHLRAEIERKDTWISVKKRLPEDLEDVLASSHDGNIITGASVCDGLWFVRDGAEWHGVYVDPVTHWRPLPAPPSERDTQEFPK